MVSSKLLLPFLLPILAAGAPTSEPAQCCRPAEDIDNSEWYNKISTQYFHLWAGDLSLAETTLHPDVQLTGDRFPAPNGTVRLEGHTREEFIGFIQGSRAGWTEYYFEIFHSVASDYTIAIRWAMHGILGDDWTRFPTTRQPGDAVTYNGTEYLILDQCTGLIREAATAQDLIQFFWAMGSEGIPLSDSS